MRDVKEEFLIKFTKVGPDKFYRFLLSIAIIKLASYTDNKNKVSPDLELLEYYDKFFALYRREDNETYRDIAILCRKAAHKIHRTLVKSNRISKNAKFLYLVEMK